MNTPQSQGQLTAEKWLNKANLNIPTSDAWESDGKHLFLFSMKLIHTENSKLLISFMKYVATICAFLKIGANQGISVDVHDW